MQTGESKRRRRVRGAVFAALTAVSSAAPPAARGEEAADPGAVVSGPAGARLDVFFSGYERGGFSGTVLVTREGKVLLHKGYGLADRGRETRCTTETVHDIGSITKQFTAAAILRLEMDGKLGVQDPLSKHLDGVPEDKAGITLHHLLTHTSGLDHYYGEDDAYAPRDLAVRQFLAMPLLTRPGATYRYSNPGFSLLSAVVEEVSGEPWETYLREVFFDPLGMDETGYVLPRWNVFEVARNYNGEKDNGWTFNRNWGPDGPYWHLFGNGGILTTTGDMLAWEQALMSDRVLSAEARRKLLEPHVSIGDEGPGGYAYGWRVGMTESDVAYSGHGGGSGYGVAAAHYRFPESDTLVLVFSNTAGYPGGIGGLELAAEVESLATAP